MKKRSSEKEQMDLKTYSLEEYEKALHQLNLIGKWLGRDSMTLKKIKDKPSSILDIGCGGGYLTKQLAKKFPQATVVGIDIDSNSIAYAKKKHTASNLSFECKSLDEIKEKYDVIISTLVCHHLEDEELITFLAKAHKIAAKVILNDLHRHVVPYLFFRMISPLFFNKLIQKDGLLSIRRSFKKQDWVKLLKKANINSYKISWHFPFRWVIEIG